MRVRILLEQDLTNAGTTTSLCFRSTLVVHQLNRDRSVDLKQLRLLPRYCVPRQVLQLYKNSDQQAQALQEAVFLEMIALLTIL